MKPPVEKISTTIEIFTIKQPTEEIEVTLPNGQKEKQWRYQHFHFTTADRPVTYNGVQHVPLSYFDQVRWDEVAK
jgi:hypothetical protein